MGRGFISKKAAMAFTGTGLVAVATSQTSIGQKATMYAGAAADTVIILGEMAAQYTWAGLIDPKTAALCAPMGPMEALQDPLAFFSGAYRNPKNGFLTEPYIKSAGLTDQELDSDACAFGKFMGAAAISMGAGMATAKAGSVLLRAAKITFQRPKSLTGRLTLGAATTVGGMVVNMKVADAIHERIGDDNRPVPPVSAPVPALH